MKKRPKGKKPTRKKTRRKAKPQGRIFRIHDGDGGMDDFQEARSSRMAHFLDIPFKYHGGF